MSEHWSTPCNGPLKPNPDSSGLFLAVSRAAGYLNHDRGWRHGIESFLAALGRATSSNRAWMFEVVDQGPDHYTTKFVYEWASSPEYSEINKPRYDHHRVNINTDDRRAFYESRLNGDVLRHHRNSVGAFLRLEFELQNIQSMLTIPIMVDGTWWGILGFDDCDAPRDYSDSMVAALEIAATLITNGILRDRLEWEVNHDHLTGLHNRRALIQRIERSLLTSPDLGSLIIIDLDDFKHINDTLGHQAGDAALKAVANLLSSALPKGATLSRFGGEEFALWLPADGNAACALAENMREKLEHLDIHWQNSDMAIRASFGVAQMRPCPHPEPTQVLFDKVFARADRALFEAKTGGRNQVVYTD
ncbi:GGDEF domain-containing protein [Saccharospirillum alexandrii]|uniref:GGDEF domain-containing protein n=1 Tax=Saccharospirillum alexandrii TaxID=2448477 RepID=UPI000FD8FE86|nr:sensor domain-containing diguanylate cyclase [Saccharospirillum alexandrii]